MVINEKGFQKISTDRKFVIACYAEMLTRINENEVAKLIKSTLVEGKLKKKKDLSSEKLYNLLVFISIDDFG